MDDENYGKPHSPNTDGSFYDEAGRLFSANGERIFEEETSPKKKSEAPPIFGEDGRPIDDVSVVLDKQLKIATLEELLSHQFPTREPILSPVFNLASLNMIFARRGIGKTHAGLGVAYAAASGIGFWNWKATRPFKTLYIDGEMPGEALQTRMAEIVKANDIAPPEGYFRFITIDMNEGTMPDISTLGGQIQIEHACQEANVIVIDNLSCLCRSGRENEAESWLAISTWAMRMRSLGKCVIFIHHAGKNGEQRGTSKREDILDIVIELKRPADYEPEQGARFVVQFTKGRHLKGDEAQSFEAKLETIGGKQVWTTKAIVESTYEQVIELYELGLSVSDIAIELGINKSNVSRHKNKAIEEGRLIEKKKDNVTPISKARLKRKDIDDDE
jgi:AAA domain